MKVKLIIIIICIITISCTTWRSALKNSGDINIAIQNSIYDFVYTNKLCKESTVFSVQAINISNDIFGVSIIGSEHKLFPTPINKLGSSNSNFPTRYLEVDNKLFIWYDSTTTVSKNLINILSKYNYIDSLNVNGIVRIPDFSVDDSKEAMDYYFCRNNLLKYRKLSTSIAMGYYNPPKIDCDLK